MTHRRIGADAGTTSHDSRMKKTALVVSTLAGFLTPFMGSSINVALPSIAAEFSLNAVSLGWVATIYILGAAMFLVPFGRLADIYGRKKIFLLGLAIYSAASILSAFSFSGPSLIVFRAFQGFGAAMIFGTSVAILTSVYPPGERGRVLGINTAAVYFGLSLGPVLGGFLTQHFGWRSLFLINVPIALIALALTIVRLPGEWAEAKGEKFDLAGSAVFGLGLTALMYGFSIMPGKKGSLLVFGGLAALVVFILMEKASTAPILDVRLFSRNKVFAFSNAAALINYSATSAVSFLLSLYLQYVKGFSPQKAGLVLIAQPVIMAFISPLSGTLSDRIEPRNLASLGMALSSAGLALFILLDSGSSLAFVVAGLFSIGFGFGIFSSPNTNAVMGSVDKRFYGVASATLGTMRLTGQMLSLGIPMMIFAVIMGRVRIGPENLPLFLRSLRVAFIIFSALCMIGIFASHARGPKQATRKS